MKIGIVENRLAAWTGYAARSVMKQIPGARWDKNNRCWTYPLAYPSALSLSVAAEHLREHLEPDEVALTWVRGEMEQWGVLAAESGKIAADEGNLGGFFAHQVQCAHWLALPGAAGGRLDTSETGSGKTRAALRAAWECWTNGETGILLVSTLVAVKYGWRNEVSEVSEALPLPDGKAWQVFSLPNGSTSDRRRKLIAEAEKANEDSGGVGVVLLVNHEQLRGHSRQSSYGDIPLKRCPKCGGVREGNEVVKESACQAHDKELNLLPYVAVVYDECHRMMNPTAQTTRAAWAIADRSPRTWGLTGTPGSRAIMENTWALSRLVYGKDWPSKSSWTKYFAETGYNSLGIWEIGQLLPAREEEFRKSYSAQSRRVLKAQVLDLPPLLRGGTLERYIEMKGEQLEVYKMMRDKLWLQVEEGEVTARNTLVQMSRLTMLANATGVPGPHYGEFIRMEIDSDGNEVPVYNAEMKLRLPSNKVDALVDMGLSGDFDGPTALQFVHPELVYLVRDKFVEKKIISHADAFGIIAGGVPEGVRAATIQRFQEGRMPFIAFTTGAGGTGITLTAAGTMVAVERPWSSIQWRQAQDRVHRIGSERHEVVSIIDLITENSVELGQLKRFNENAEALEQIVRDKDRMHDLLFGEGKGKKK